jgi:hypothetical protein
MSKRINAAALAWTGLSLFAVLDAGAAENAVIWAANPAGAQSVPQAASVTLLPSNGYVPLKTASGKCLLVARRGTQIVAVELSPLTQGDKLIGWKPQAIDMSTLTSKWGYSIDGAAQNRTELKKDGSYATSSAWGNTHVESIARGETQSAVTVTQNGKTYRKYSHFKPATPDMPVAASDEYFCR